MAVLIRNPKTEDMIRELARRTGDSLTDAVEKAVARQLDLTAPPPGRVDRRKLRSALAYFDALPRADRAISDDEIVGYDELGLPR